MPTFREILLTRPGPLEADEVDILETWLTALKGDVEAFGATPEDEARMKAIEDRIAATRDPVAPGARGR